MTTSTRRAVITVAMAVGAFAVVAPMGFARGPQDKEDRPAASGASATPDLTGLWILNEELSEKPPERGRGGESEGRGGRPPRGGGGGMGGFGGGGRRGGFPGGEGGNARSREDIERMRAVMEVALRAPGKLTIVRSEAVLVVTDEDGRSVRLTLDGKKNKSTVDGLEVETSSKWDDGVLRVERKFKGDMKAVDELSLPTDPRILVMTTKVEGGGTRGRALTLKRVYDRQEPRNIER
jgi:hypothetical protein